MTKELDVPFRFGKGFDTEITLEDGEWKMASQTSEYNQNVLYMR